MAEPSGVVFAAFRKLSAGVKPIAQPRLPKALPTAMK
jgi:hypothetical protein